MVLLSGLKVSATKYWELNSQYFVRFPIYCENRIANIHFWYLFVGAESLYGKGFCANMSALEKDGIPFGYNNCAKQKRQYENSNR